MDDLHRAKKCLAAFSDAWDSGDIFILAAPVNEKGAINIGHPYVRTKEQPEGNDPQKPIGGKVLPLGGTGSLKVGDKKYSALLWNGGEPGGGFEGGVGVWKEGNNWIEIARKSGAELLRGDYGVNATGGSPVALWAMVVVAELWDTDWRMPAPGKNHFIFSAYSASIETWKRIIRRCEQQALAKDEDYGMSVAVIATTGVGLFGLLSGLIYWLVYRRNKLRCNKDCDIESPNQDASKMATIRGKAKKYWHDPVWSKVIAWVIIGILCGALGILGYLYHWFR